MRAHKGRVVVAGSANMDVVGRVDHHPGPGETVVGRDLGFFPGGKGANQAVAAARAGASTHFVGCFGADAFGDQLEAFLSEQNVSLAVRRVTGAATGTALIVVDEGGENMIVIAPGANTAVAGIDLDRVDLRGGDVLVSPFEIPLDTIEQFFRKGKNAGATTVLNPAPALEASVDLLDLADVIIVNETEAAFFAGTVTTAANDDALIDAARSMRTRDSQAVLVTLGSRGVLALTPDGTARIAGRSVKPLDTTGAGDCFTGVLAAALASGASLSSAMETGNLAAALSVERKGAGPSMPTLTEIENAR